MKQQTALQQFIQWGEQMMTEHPQKLLSFAQAIDKAEELLEVEKEQIIQAYKDGLIQHPNDFLSQEQYYNETYKKS